MLSEINLGHVKYMNSLGLNLSHFKYLLDVNEGKSVPDDKYYRALEKAGMIYDGEITSYGDDIILSMMGVEQEAVIPKAKKELSEEFEQWWSHFPSTDNFEASGTTFSGVRNLRSSKKECGVKYDNLLKEVDHQTLMNCLKYEVESRMDQSYLRGQNLLTYMKGTISYLNSRGYEAYLNLIKNGGYRRKGIEIKTIDTTNLF